MFAFFVVLLLGVAAVLIHTPWRRRLLSDRIFAVYRRIAPAMSQTEREALEAGTVWWDGELFSGRPDWNKLLALSTPATEPGGAGVPRRPDRSPVRDARRLGDQP